MAARQVHWQGALDTVDDATAALIIKLELEDAQEFATEQAAAGNYHALDAVTARQAHETELRMYRGQRGLARLEDQSVYYAEETPSATIHAAETTASETTASETTPSFTVPAPEPVANTPAEVVEIGEPAVPLFKCEACNDRVNEDHSFQAPCNHYYCDDCLTDLFRAATTDESLYPPRCCRTSIPFEGVRELLPRDLGYEFEGKRKELDDNHRIYCRVQACNAYIPDRQRQSDVATCPECKTVRCLRCTSAPHWNDCQQDEATKLFNALAAKERWPKCPGCERTIELRTGCNHMTCHCRAQFCYQCRAPWKTCQCLQWDPNRLLARGREVVGRGREGPVDAAELDAVVEQLVNQHECDHDVWWTRIDGEHRCEECNDTLRRFIYRCPQCHLQACARCKLNRL